MSLIQAHNGIKIDVLGYRAEEQASFPQTWAPRAGC